MAAVPLAVPEALAVDFDLPVVAAAVLEVAAAVGLAPVDLAAAVDEESGVVHVINHRIGTVWESP